MPDVGRASVAGRSPEAPAAKQTGPCGLQPVKQMGRTLHLTCKREQVPRPPSQHPPLPPQKRRLSLPPRHAGQAKWLPAVHPTRTTAQQRRGRWCVCGSGTTPTQPGCSAGMQNKVSAKREGVADQQSGRQVAGGGSGSGLQLTAAQHASLHTPVWCLLHKLVGDASTHWQLHGAVPVVAFAPAHQGSCGQVPPAQLLVITHNHQLLTEWHLQLKGRRQISLIAAVRSPSLRRRCAVVATFSAASPCRAPCAGC
jgi:hypothetical protein